MRRIWLMMAMAAGVPLGALPVAAQDAQTVQAYVQSCNAGDNQACLYAARAYGKGSGVAMDGRRSVGLLELACNRGSGFACRGVGIFAFYGNGGPKDMARSLLFFEKGCTLGDSESCASAAAPRAALADARGPALPTPGSPAARPAAPKPAPAPQEAATPTADRTLTCVSFERRTGTFWKVVNRCGFDVIGSICFVDFGQHACGKRPAVLGPIRAGQFQNFTGPQAGSVEWRATGCDHALYRAGRCRFPDAR